jgi:hypothetical protein
MNEVSTINPQHETGRDSGQPMSGGRYSPVVIDLPAPISQIRSDRVRAPIGYQ